MGKNTDKLFITHSEWSGPDKHSAAGGVAARKGVSQHARRLPFTYCSLSLQPFKKAVCDEYGNIFDEEHMEKWLAKHSKNPITNEPTTMASLLKLNFEKDSEGRYIDPVTFKVLTPNSHIVCIKTSGNVYSRETVDELNIKARNWSDLVTGEKFSAKDIITLQDPMNLSRAVPKPAPTTTTTTKLSTTAKRPAPETTTPASKKAALPFNASTSTTGRAAASLTSTAASLFTKSDRQMLTDDEFLLKRRRVRESGFVQIRTNLGNLNVELNTLYAPKAVYNFLKLAEKGYYNGVKFHRNIRYFMIQGGDPTGTGRGGQSYWGEPFEDEFNSPLSHDARGVLSMANKGKDTNTSQFFILYRPKPQLDRKHTIFGKVVEGLEILDKMETTPTDAEDRPQTDIVINEIAVVIDPFKEFMEKVKANGGVIPEEVKGKRRAESEVVDGRSQAEKELDEKMTWSGRLLAPPGATSGTATATGAKKRVVGKYM
ncbi:cyclophilin-like domain-containing protein [Myxozyma melibiosi]|uniref:Cyclophilin-like domain-containing protein n=1 Tax=Myxozyma melibiosi TaxID=54550 RepID=A0ABR1FEZ9_9ASCO